MMNKQVATLCSSVCTQPVGLRTPFGARNIAKLPLEISYRACVFKFHLPSLCSTTFPVGTRLLIHNDEGGHLQGLWGRTYRSAHNATIWASGCTTDPYFRIQGD